MDLPKNQLRHVILDTGENAALTYRKRRNKKQENVENVISEEQVQRWFELPIKRQKHSVNEVKTEAMDFFNSQPKVFFKYK